MYRKEELDNYNSARSSMSRSRSKSKLYKLARRKAEAEALPHEGIIGQMSRFEKSKGSPPRQLDGGYSPTAQRYQYSHGKHLSNTANPAELRSGLERVAGNRSPRMGAGIANFSQQETLPNTIGYQAAPNLQDIS